MKKVFIICSVRDADDKYRKFLEDYVQELEKNGYSVHLPHRDTNQKASSLDICLENIEAIEECDQVHISYKSHSQGSHFDLGVCLALKKPIKLIERIEMTKNKSFDNLIVEYCTNHMSSMTV